MFFYVNRYQDFLYMLQSSVQSVPVDNICRFKSAKCKFEVTEMNILNLIKVYHTKK